MAHSHAHGEAANTYFLDQLCTIAICGAIGVVAILMFNSEMQQLILAPAFRPPMLYGGLAVVVIVLVRAISVWQMAGMDQEPLANNNNYDKQHAHNHSHAHGEKCDHPDHEKCDHDHTHAHGESHPHSHDHSHSPAQAIAEEDHGHDHGWAPWRYIILMLPVVLYFLNLPNQGFSIHTFGPAKDVEGNRKMIHYPALSTVTGSIAYGMKSQEVRPIERFNELTLIGLNPQQREYYEGSRISLKGMYLQFKDNEFDLFKVKRVCCGADGLPIRVRVISQSNVQKFMPRSWLKVTGELRFFRNRDDWVPVILVESEKDIEETEKGVEFEDA